MAQTEISQRSAAQSLSCLANTGSAPRYPAHHRYDRGMGLMRVLMTFSAPDEPPTVEVLANTAREDMQNEVRRYVDHYRLSCLKPSDGKVQAVQDFSFSNSDAGPVPFGSEGDAHRQPFCLVMPGKDIERPNSWPTERELAHVVVAMRFAGGGDSPPEVTLLHSTGTKRFEESIRDYVAHYRMPCHAASDEPRVFRQQFSYVPAGVRRTVLTRDVFDLGEFLGLTAHPRDLRGHFDFNTMSCPFQVSFRSYGPALPNEATVAGRADPNRQAFLTWVAGLKLNYKNDRQANDLFGTQIQIKVPCGVLDLEPETQAQAVE